MKPNEVTKSLERRLQDSTFAARNLWLLAGGWVVDCLVGEPTREHRDIDLAMAQDDFAEFECYVKSSHKRQAVTVVQDSWIESNQHFESLDANVPSLDVFVLQAKSGYWQFGGNSAVSEPWEDIYDTASWMRVMRPEIILLYKSVRSSFIDNTDLEVALPHLSDQQCDWLAKSIAQVHGRGHEWLLSLR